MPSLEITELKAYRDARGWNTHPLNENVLRSGGFSNIHLVSIEPGSIRGNHVHIKQTERVMIFGGRCLFIAKDAPDSEPMERTFTEEDLFLITIPPGLPHAFKNTGEKTMFLLCASDVPFDPANPDTERIELI